MEDINNNGCIQVGNIYPDSENMANRPGGRVYSTTGCAPTILSRDFKQPKMIMEEPKAVSYTRDSKGKTQNKHLNEIVNTIHSSTGSGGNTDCFVAEPKVQQIGNIYPDKEGFKNRTAGRIFSANGLSPTLRTMSGGHQEPKIEFRYRIRKLTPRECFRLMDVDENVIDTIQAAGISNSQQYKLAGNSIVVACLEKIFEQMFFPQYTNSRTLFG